MYASISERRIYNTKDKQACKSKRVSLKIQIIQKNQLKQLLKKVINNKWN